MLVAFWGGRWGAGSFSQGHPASHQNGFASGLVTDVSGFVCFFFLFSFFFFFFNSVGAGVGGKVTAQCPYTSSENRTDQLCGFCVCCSHVHCQPPWIIPADPSVAAAFQQVNDEWQRPPSGPVGEWQLVLRSSPAQLQQACGELCQHAVQ